MKFFTIIILVLLAPSIIAQTYSFHMIDITNDDVIRNVRVYSDGLDTQVDEYLTVSASLDGTEINIDDETTPGVDYVGTIDVRASRIEVMPVGTISGTVMSKGKPVPFAGVKVECTHNDETIIAGENGFFSVILGAGDCRLLSTYEGRLGQTIFTLGRGETKEVTLDLDTRLSASPLERLWIILAIPVFGIVAYFILRKNKD